MKKIAFVRHLGEPNSAFQKEEFSVFLEAKGISLVDVEAFDKQDIAKYKKKQLTLFKKVIPVGIAAVGGILLALSLARKR